MEIQHLQPINTVAEILNVTPRRIRQFVEDGNVPRPERGQVDLAWCLYFNSGLNITDRWMTKPRDPKTLVALAWLAGVANPSDDDIAAFAGLFERNGFDRDAALLALGTARGLLGRR